MTRPSQFALDCHHNLNTCLTAWPAIVTECDAAAFATPGAGTNSAADADPTTLRPGIAKAGQAAGWVAQWHDWVVLVVGDHTGIAWSVPAVAALVKTPFTVIVEHVDAAGGWRARRHNHDLLVCVALLELANKGSAYVPRIAKGTRMAGVTVGERTNSTEVCGECGDVILCTADDRPKYNGDGVAFHREKGPKGNWCYHDYWNRRRAADTARSASGG